MLKIGPIVLHNIPGLFLSTTLRNVFLHFFILGFWISNFWTVVFGLVAKHKITKFQRKTKTSSTLKTKDNTQITKEDLETRSKQKKKQQTMIKGKKKQEKWQWNFENQHLNQKTLELRWKQCSQNKQKEQNKKQTATKQTKITQHNNT